MSAVLKAERLAKTFRVGFWRKKVVALKDATFDVGSGEIFGLVGPNGAGKTTSIKILTGLVKADSGEGALFGHALGSTKARAELGYLPEGPYFYEYLTVVELLDYYGALFGMSARARKKRAEELVALVGLEHAKDRPLRKFSKGMLQRAGLAQALVHDPRLIILDEPKTGLDPIGRAQVDELIRGLKKEGKSIFFASHILPDVEKVCDRVALMIQGRVVDVGPMDRLLDAKVLSVEAVVEGMDEVHLDEATSLGLRVSRLNEEQVLLSSDTREQGRAIVELVSRSGAALRSYEERREHLEDLFLRMAKGATSAKEQGDQ